MFSMFWFAEYFPFTLSLRSSSERTPKGARGFLDNNIEGKDFEASTGVWVKSTRFREGVYSQEGGGSKPV